MFSRKNPGLGNRSTNRRMRRAVYPVSSRNSRRAPATKLSSPSRRPAINSHKYCSTLCRYCRIKTIPPSANTGKTTTDPGCTIMSRVAVTPLGSTTFSRCTSNTRVRKTSSLLKTFAVAFFFATFAPVIPSSTKHTNPISSSPNTAPSPRDFLPPTTPLHILFEANQCQSTQ
jgi:hypothetical protein